MAIRQFWPFGILMATTLAAGAVLIPLAGCSDPNGQHATQPNAAGHSDQPHVDPESLLRLTFQRYRAAETYSDHARVRLAYDVAGRRESQWAPLSVRLDQRNFYVEAYSLRCFCDSRQTLAWIIDEATHNFDGQVSVGPAPAQRGDWEQLTLDPIFQQHLSAGLGGPPPQLDWLFAAEPMQRLFDQQHRFEFGAQQTIDNRTCQSVIVRADAQHYVFWIDREAMIIREVELPSVIAAPATNQPPQTMSLTVQLSDATFQPLQQPPTIDPLPKRPHYVQQFVPLPPLEPDHALGSKLSPPLLSQLRTRSTTDTVSLVVCVPDPYASQALTQLLAYWYDKLPPTMANSVSLFQVASHSIDESTTPATVTVLRDDPRIWSDSLTLPGGGIAIVSVTGTLAWTQATVSPNELSQLSVIVADIIQGVDVPTRLKTEWQAAQAAYQAELKRRHRAPLN